MVLENFSCINVLNVPLTRGHPEENGFPNIPIDDMYETGGNSHKSIISNWMNKSSHNSNEAYIFLFFVCEIIRMIPRSFLNRLFICFLVPFKHAIGMLISTREELGMIYK